MFVMLLFILTPLQSQSLERVRALVEAGEYEKAVDEARVAYQNRPSADAIQSLVESLIINQNSDFTEAETLAKQWVEMARNNGDKGQLSEALSALGTILKLRNQPFEGRAQLQESVELLLELYGNGDPRTANGLAALGSLLVDISEFQLARTFLTNSLQIRTNAIGENSLQVADSYYRIGLLAQEEQKDDEAEAALQRSREIRTSLLGENHPLVAECLQAQGTLAELRSDFSRANELYRQALGIRSQTLGTHLLTAESSETLGRVLEGSQQDEPAERLMQQALQIRERILGPDSIPVAVSLNQLGGFWRRRGESGKSKEAFERALGIMRARRGAPHYDIATSLNNLAIANWDLRNFELALDQLQQVAAMWEQLDAWREQAFALVNQGELLWDWGRLQQAVPLFAGALKLRREKGEPAIQVAETVERLAQLYLEMGYYEPAYPFFQEVLDDRLAALGAQHPLVAQALENLGQIQRARGLYQDSINYHQRALEAREQLFGQAHPLVAQSQESLGSVQQALGHYAEAEKLFTEALQTRELIYGADTAGILPGLRLQAGLEIDKGNYPAAEARLTRAKTVVRNTLGETHPAWAALDIREADLRVLQGRPEEARPLYASALQILAASAGENHPSTAAIYNNLGNLDRQLADYTQARENYQKAYDIYQAAYGPESPSALTGMNNLATVAFETGDYATAARLYEAVYQSLQSSLGDSHPLVAGSASSLASIRQLQGHYEESEALFRQALQIRESRFGDSHPEVAESCNALAQLLVERGEGSAARPLFERAIQIWEVSFGSDHPSVASGLNNLASLLVEFNDLNGALPLMQRALKIRRDALGEKHPLVAGSLNGLAEIYRENGQYSEARPLYEQALEIWRETLGNEHPSVATGLSNLATLNRQSGDYGVAEQQLMQAVSILESRLGPNHPQVARLRFDLAATLHGQGRDDEALVLAESALQTMGQKLGPSHPRVATVKIQVAGFARDSGDPGRAESLYNDARSALEEAYGSQSLQVAAVVQSLGILAHRAGRFSEAEQDYQQSLTIWRDALGEDNPSVAVGTLNLAALQAATGKFETAFAGALQAESAGRTHLRLTVRTLPERQALRYAAVRVSGKDLALTLVAERKEQVPDAANRAWDAVVRSRAVVLDEMALRRRVLYDSSSPEVRDLLDRFRRVGEQLAGWTVLGPGRDSVEAYRQRLQELAAERESLEQQLARFSSTSSIPSSSEVGLKDVLTQIPNGTALISYARYRSYPLQANAPAPWSYLAFIGRSKGSIETVSLGPAEEIEPLISDWYHEASRGIINQQWAQKEAETLYRRVASQLRAKIWDPLEPHLTGIERILIVPDGALNFVSFSSLPRETGGYFVEDARSIHYLAAERDLGLPGRSSGENQGLLVLGGASFDAIRAAARAAQRDPVTKDSCSPFDLVRFGALPGALEEASSVTAAWNAAEAGRVDELTGDRASEAEFKRLAAGRSVIHLATHGFVLGDTCQGGAEKLEDILLESGAAEEPIENPLLRSGLALAGANQRASQPEGEDGILTAEEVAALDLQGVDWAVLSACNTGIGKLQNGEGVLGLRRAFQIAGVKTLVMSLWPVDDDSTRELMTSLYEQRFGQGLEADKALQKASQLLLERRRAEGLATHPFFWGAFVAAGALN